MAWLRCMAAAVCAASLLSAPAQAAQKVCVYDFIGASGDLFNMVRDYALAMQRDGVFLELKGYNDEAAALEAYKSGQCDGFVGTAFRSRQFNAVAGSIDSLGATTIVRKGNVDMPASYEVMRKLIQTYAAPSPQVAKLMTNGEHEVAGIAPAGAAYPFVNDRKLSSVEALAGKRIVAFDYDKAQGAMIQRIKAIPVSATISNFHLKFNGGQADMMAAPTIAYQPLELSKGLGSKGAVVRFPLLLVSYQMVIRHAQFPDGFGAKSRTFWAGQFDRMLQLIRRADTTIPPARWEDLNPDDAVKYTLLLRESRIQLTQQGLYDKRGLKVLKRIRCHVNPGDAECETKLEEE
ncbi:putative solute-binding protein [Aquabacterium sp. UBA2148]|uniref:putative solute-binding protein n=1 Tax=Aquabacterium sp. UBA2148 TaxID=1946042 RepID=UPI0025811789|nr:putative solute-binding protein [Aquabacterium sp. UBA2148]